MSEERSLEEQLQDAANAAAQLRASSTTQEALQEADLAEVASSGQHIDRFLLDVQELLKQIFVAGLAFPAHELCDELATLSERARLLSMPTALERLLKLRAWLLALLEEKKTERRLSLAESAFAETQRLLAWLRMFRLEQDFVTVQAKMAAEATGQTTHVSNTPTQSADLWMLGVDLSSTGRALFYAYERETGRLALLHDHLGEVSPEDPFGARVISRLFQDAISLRDLFRSLVRVEQHPYTERGGRWIFQPAFQAIPKMIGVTRDFQAPLPPVLRRGSKLASPARVEVTLRWSQGKLLCLYDGADFPLLESALLQFSFLKYLINKKETEAQLSLVVVPEGDSYQTLSLTDDLGDRVFPSLDASLFRCPIPRVKQEADARSKKIPALERLFLQAAALALVGGTPDEAAAIEKELSALTPSGISSLYRDGMIRFLLRLPQQRDRAKPAIEAALSLASRTKKTEEPVDREALSLALGRPSAFLSEADLPAIDSTVVYQALWLIDACGFTEELLPALQKLKKTRYKGTLKDSSAANISARALLLGMLERHNTQKEKEEESEEETSAAFDFLSSHLEEHIKDSKRAQPKQVLPEPVELLQLCDTLAYLQGTERNGATIVAAGFPRSRFLQSGATTLLSLFTEEDPSHRRIAEGLLLASAAGLRPLLVV